MLDAGAHALALYALDEGGGHFAGNVGVFGVILKVSAAEGRTLDVHRRPQQNADVFRLALVAQGSAHALHQRPVKGRGGGASGRKADRLDAVVDTQMVARLVLLAQSVGPVAHHHRRDVQTLDGLGVPEIAAGTKACLFLQGQLLQ